MMVKVYNLVTEEYDKVGRWDLYHKFLSHPHLDVMKDPYSIQKILEEAIFGAGTNYGNCEYCSYRYDLNKEGRCPNCGATHRKND